MTHAPQLPSLEDKVAFLSRASAYPDYEGEVTPLETHMSWVFLTEHRVYKLKKPTRRTLADLRSVDARYQNCQEELRLNRRLGGDTYIGVERLSLSSGDRLQIGETGVAVDWLVVMRRVPDSAFLETQIKAGEVDYQRLAEAGDRLSAFYRDAVPVELSPAQYRDRLEREVSNNQQSLNGYALSPRQLQIVHDHQLAVLDDRAAMFNDRAERKKIIEAHGDLRPEHLCLTDPPVMIDCLEFSRDLRVQDPVDELSFLDMECERLGDRRVGEILFDRYTDHTHDEPALALVAFYKSYRACVRAKLCVWHLDDHGQQDADHWLQKARNYLDMAERYTVHFHD